MNKIPTIIGGFGLALLNIGNAAIEANREFEKLDISIKQWRENEKLRLGISDKELDDLLETDRKIAAAGFPGWYENIISVIKWGAK